MNNQPSHNLNIQSYSLEEVLGLFDLKYKITLDDLKRAKKKVLMLHPDKSKLAADYFLFYKKALDIVVRFYENQNRQNAAISPEKTQYVAENVPKSMSKQINKVIDSMGADGFQSKFNELFENNMTRKPNQEKNAWFQNDDPTYQIDSNVSASNMGQVLETIKQKNQGLVKYSGVTHLYSGGGPGTNFYEDAEDEHDDSYVTSDPFSKLKYDDLRKVHKDQTVFAVSESDYRKIPQYSSVDHFVRERGRQNNQPMDKTQAEQILANQEREMQEKMMQRQYQSNLRSMEYAEKNKSVLSSFLYLGNGK